MKYIFFIFLISLTSGCSDIKTSTKTEKCCCCCKCQNIAIKSIYTQNKRRNFSEIVEKFSNFSYGQEQPASPSR